MFRFMVVIGLIASVKGAWAGEPPTEFAALVSMQRQPGGMYYVDASPQGHNSAIPFLVDTGSSYLVLNEVLLKELKARGTAEYVEEIEGLMADGSRKVIPIYRIKALRIGDACWIRDIEAAIFPADTRPILGMNVLARLAPFTLSDGPPTLALNKCHQASPVASTSSVVIPATHGSE